MSFKEKLAEATGISKSLLPSSCQTIGHVMLLKLTKVKTLKQKRAIASAVLSTYPCVKTVCEMGRVEGELRIPKVNKLAGNGTITVHKEHGILYKLDASKIMFSKGNLFERQRLLSQVKANETVVDMFAGIGYFSLPVSKRAKEVISIEKNPVSFGYLIENIALNRIRNISPMLADNRDVPLNDIADRIIMGYFPDTHKFLPFALRMLKKKGMIHYHNVYKKPELWKKPIGETEKAFGGVKWKIVGKKVVKSVAPNTYHVVLDIAVKKLK